MAKGQCSRKPKAATGWRNSRCARLDTVLANTSVQRRKALDSKSVTAKSRRTRKPA